MSCAGRLCDLQLHGWTPVPFMESCEKDFVHLEQEYRVLPVWVLWCVFRVLDLEKELSQTGQGRIVLQCWSGGLT